MTTRFQDAGVAPVTVIAAGPCTVTQVKGERDGYTAVQIGYSESTKKAAKPHAGHLKGLPNFRHLQEFRGDHNVRRGQVISVSTFTPGETVSVMGVSKGKGFQGVVKRHGFHGSPKTHGHKDQLRMPGSIGAGGVQHVFKGRRMAGRMGGERTTVQGLTVIDVDAEKNLLYVKGAVPGARNTLIAIVGEGELILTDAATQTAPAATSESAAAEQPAVAESAAEQPAAPETPLAPETPATPESETSSQEAAEQTADIPKT